MRKKPAPEDLWDRDLIKTGRWEEEIGDLYDALLGGRETGDYGGAAHVSQ